MLTGCLDIVSTSRISGWVYNSSDPGEHLKVIVHGPHGEIASSLADIERPDLVGRIGDGDHSFRIDVPPGLRIDELSVQAFSKSGERLDLLLGFSSAIVARPLESLFERVAALERRIEDAEVFIVRIDAMLLELVEASKKKRRKRFLGIF